MTQPKRRSSTPAKDLGTFKLGTQDLNKPLTGMQSLFVTHLVHDRLNPTISAREAGFKQPATAAWALMRNPKVVRAIAVERETYALASNITKKAVIDGMMEAIDMAKMKADPAVMVAGWREIGKLCGFYEPTVHKLEVTAKGAALLAQMDSMSDAELLELAAPEGVIIEGEVESG